LNEKLIIFDLDGTLYKTECVSLEAIQNALLELNLPVPDNEKILSFIGERMEDFCKKLIPESFSELQNVLPERIMVYERALIPKKAELYNDIEKILRKLTSSGYTLAVCSNASKKYIDLVLNTSGIADFFKYIKGIDLTKSKANLIKEILTESNPSFAIVIGDTVYDINAAHENNLPCIGVKYGYGREEDILKADFNADNPEDILNHIRRMNVLFNESGNDSSKLH